ncbi:MAG: type II toxin-antitoxin system RelE/ParE family toxin [Devosia sp.]
MPLEVRRTHAADRDLYEIWLYVRVNNAPAADQLLRRISERFALLAQNPLLGRSRPELGEALRSFYAEGYAIFYRHTDTTLSITRVLSHYRDATKQAFPER